MLVHILSFTFHYKYIEDFKVFAIKLCTVYYMFIDREEAHELINFVCYAWYVSENTDHYVGMIYEDDNLTLITFCLFFSGM